MPTIPRKKRCGKVGATLTPTYKSFPKLPPLSSTGTVSRLDIQWLCNVASEMYPSRVSEICAFCISSDSSVQLMLSFCAFLFVLLLIIYMKITILAWICHGVSKVRDLIIFRNQFLQRA